MELFLEAIDHLQHGEIGKIVWQTPADSMLHTMTIDNGVTNTWQIHHDAASGAPVIGLYRNLPAGTAPGNQLASAPDATLLLSIDGFGSPAGARLLHVGDDIARKYYCAIDNGNHNQLGVPAFVLRAEGLK